MFRLDSKNGIILTGVLSVVFAIIYLVIAEANFRYYGSFDLGTHVSALQILASICLVIGAIKEKYMLFVPWMITCVFFLYLMVYLGIVLMAHDDWLIFVPAMVVPFTAYLGYALFSVQKALERMRKDSPPSYTNIDGKKDFISHI
ncbi:uncharacterized protein LOC111077007 [Drosophila obscura]|uniref:uncharacterized protein LOC111077007 n=1 Tax=Drosophila obscura TaxID=7282 RepID=UPI001BB26A18|nr:uncharacterized protein LOC111077007 [Drosophila obscura]XP_041448840.1 uncharacterized protein LOC111077007 [Drosophila obscura]XP_041448841.1 uncharacterized protein LOC111077007 [Drosophila obscura]